MGLFPLFVMPAKAGIHLSSRLTAEGAGLAWIPASAGMTNFSASDGKLIPYPGFDRSTMLGYGPFGPMPDI
jgi:hypothetical protein